MLVIERYGEAAQTVNADAALLAYFEIDSVASLCNDLLFKFRDAGHQFFFCRIFHIDTSIKAVSGNLGFDNSASNELGANHVTMYG